MTAQAEWEARWSGGMKETAVLVHQGELIPQAEFARHIRHVLGGSELYRADVETGDYLLLLYISGSGRTQTARLIHSPADWSHSTEWRSWDEAEQELSLPEGSLNEVFRGRRVPPN